MGSDDLRVGTSEREAAVNILGDHFSEGRLAMEEYEQRVGAALEATTRGDLRPLFRDLPPPYPAFMVPPVQRQPPLPAHRARSEPAVMSDKSKLAAGVLQILLPFGIGRFYTGHTGVGLAQLLTSFMFVGIVWSVIDGILLIVNGGVDGEGRRLRD
ncbi:hypothetical protein BLA60_39135 [Actinophytocola xinjiangensis]|uniref:TM2 domain-containing protein n=1 Tax=Actinophytocola xinjiangensis TaxID=485602 RepID=A0A7Z0WE37_9PSEU|nr:DUF1707 domain-containing protein [Actinophytocola xinjiangensis]OLF04795.1 hypothetical protein BLA60_39135 [Actinophytocola xinjiangensis]